MAHEDTTFGDRSAMRAAIAKLMQDRHARKDMLHGLFRDHFTTPATIRCELPDHVVHLSPQDSTITPAVLAKGHWNRDELERAILVLRSAGVLRENGLFLDVGANIGTHSIYACLSGAFRGVQAFEPDPENARLFALNIKENDLADSVQLIAMGLGDEDGTANLFRHASNHGAHSLVLPAGAERGDCVPVDVITLDSHMDRTGLQSGNVSLISIDVEGHEPAVIRGAGRLLDGRVPLVFEFLDRDRHRPDVAAMLATLRAAYDTAYRLQDEGLGLMPITRLTEEMPEGDYLVFCTDD